MRLYRPTYTRFVNGKRKTRLSSKWYCRIKVNGRWRAVPLSPDKRASEIMAADLLRKHELERAGGTDPHGPAANVPLAGHVADFAAHLRQKGSGERHVGQVERYLLRTFDAAGAVMPRDVRPTDLARYLTQRRTGAGISPRRHNWECGTIRGFFAWMVREGRLDRSPASGLGRVNEQAGRRLVRRPLTDDEFARLVATARSSPRVYRGLTGRHRAALYQLALGTGFRVSELASLTAGAFDLTGRYPAVTLAAKDAKNGRRAVQPMPDFAVTAMREHLSGCGVRDLAFPGSWSEKAARMLRIDLAAAGIPHRIDSPDGILTVDFHAIRHTFVHALKRAGVRVDDAARLARHSDVKLTLAIYGQSSYGDLAEAVNRLTPARHEPRTELDETARNYSPTGAEPDGGPSREGPDL